MNPTGCSRTSSTVIRRSIWQRIVPAFARQIFKNALPGLFYHGDKRPAGYGGGDTFGKRSPTRTTTTWRPGSVSPGIRSKRKTSVRGGYAIFYDEPS